MWTSMHLLSSQLSMKMTQNCTKLMIKLDLTACGTRIIANYLLMLNCSTDHTNLMQKATKTPGGRISITLSLFDDNDHRRANTYLFYHNNLPTISHEKEHTMQEWLKLTPLLINIYYFNRDQFQVLILSQWSVPGKGVCTRHHQQQ